MSPTEFTPWAGLIGGGMIGLAAVVLMAVSGRVLGASGIFAGILVPRFNEAFTWRAIFLVGLLSGTIIANAYTGTGQTITYGSNATMTAVGGVIVGIGVMLGNGCTSGHGICGLARFSLRSLVATCTFMVVALFTVFLIRHVVGVS
jgi:uncharacterized protein